MPANEHFDCKIIIMQREHPAGEEYYEAFLFRAPFLKPDKKFVSVER